MNFKKWVNKLTPEQFLSVVGKMHPYDSFPDLPIIAKKFAYWTFEPKYPIVKTSFLGCNTQDELVAAYRSMPRRTMPPVLLEEDGRIIDGCHRIEAFKQQRQTTIPAFIGFRQDDS